MAPPSLLHFQLFLFLLSRGLPIFTPLP
jgi:hypothetical protein